MITPADLARSQGIPTPPTDRDSVQRAVAEPDSVTQASEASGAESSSVVTPSQAAVSVATSGNGDTNSAETSPEQGSAVPAEAPHAAPDPAHTSVSEATAEPGSVAGDEDSDPDSTAAQRLDIPQTGHPVVDQALASLAGIDQMSAAERLQALTAAHQQIADVLAQPGTTQQAIPGMHGVRR